MGRQCAYVALESVDQVPTRTEPHHVNFAGVHHTRNRPNNSNPFPWRARKSHVTVSDFQIIVGRMKAAIMRGSANVGSSNSVKG